MSILWSWIKGFGRFWYGFIIGDDWFAAAGVAVALAGTYGLTRSGIAAWWFAPVVIISVATLTVRRALSRQAADGC